MEYTTVQVNNKIVKKVINLNQDNRPIKGADLVTELYSQIFVVAKKNSGKSTVLFNLIPELIDKTTKVFAFCKTIDQDNIWINMKKTLKDHKIEFSFFSSIIDDEEGVNNLQVILNEIKELKRIEEEEKNESEDDIKIEGLLIGDYTFKKKKKLPKFQVPEYLFIFDDISDELKNSSIIRLLKTNRHFKSKVIISSQYPYDLLPESRKNIDLWLLFKGETMEKLFQLHKDMDSELNFNEFYSFYKEATQEKYNFFYCDARLSDYRINFNEKFIYKRK